MSRFNFIIYRFTRQLGLKFQYYFIQPPE